MEGRNSMKRTSTSGPTPERGLPEPERHIHIMSHELAEQLSRQTPEAQALAAIALAFCRECRGWKNAHSINDFGYPYISESVSKKLADPGIPPYQRHFHYTHADKVMAAVREWLSAMDAYDAVEKFEDIFNFSFGSYFVGAQDEAEICRDLMAACLEANRRRES